MEPHLLLWDLLGALLPSQGLPERPGPEVQEGCFPQLLAARDGLDVPPLLEGTRSPGAPCGMEAGEWGRQRPPLRCVLGLRGHAGPQAHGIPTLAGPTETLSSRLELRPVAAPSGLRGAGGGEGSCCLFLLGLRRRSAPRLTFLSGLGPAASLTLTGSQKAGCGVMLPEGRATARALGCPTQPVLLR